MAVIFLKDIVLHHVLVDFSFSSLRAFFENVTGWLSTRQTFLISWPYCRHDVKHVNRYAFRILIFFDVSVGIANFHYSKYLYTVHNKT